MCGKVHKTLDEGTQRVRGKKKAFLASPLPEYPLSGLLKAGGRTGSSFGERLCREGRPGDGERRCTLFVVPFYCWKALGLGVGVS